MTYTMQDKKLYVHSDKNCNVPAHLNFGKYMIDRLRLKKDEIALENSDTRKKLTYAELTQFAVNLSASLKMLGVGRGDIVAIGSEKRNEYLPTLFAVVFSGATYTPLDIDNGRVTLKHMIELIKPKYFICSKLFWETYKNERNMFNGFKKILTWDDGIESAISIKSLISHDVDVNHFEPAQVQGQTDVAIILYSSGTTGLPKGVQLTHLNCIISSMHEGFSDPALETSFIYGGWSHNYSTFNTFKFLVLGRKVVYVTQMKLQTFLKAVEDYQINIAFILPSVIEQLLKSSEISKYNLDSLKIIYSRATTLHGKTINKLKERLPKLQGILQGYGMTEAGELSSEIWATKSFKAGSVGKATPGNILKVIDTQTNNAVGPNKHGVIYLHSPSFMKGYVGVDPSTYLDEEGFFKTGDLGYYDDDNYFFIVGRLKDIIDYDGNKFSPLELETILLLHSAVREVAVLGKPVPFYGEEPIAFVVKNSDIGVTEKELIDHVASEAPFFMHLRGGVKFIEKLPRNSTGKILRHELRNMLLI